MRKLQKEGKAEGTKRKQERRRVKVEDSLHPSCRSPEAVIPASALLLTVRNLFQVHHAGRAHTCKIQWKVNSRAASHKRARLAPPVVGDWLRQTRGWGGWGGGGAASRRTGRSPRAGPRAGEEGGPGVRRGGSGSGPRLPRGGSAHGAGWRQTRGAVWPPGGTWWCGTCGECSWPAARRAVVPTPGAEPPDRRGASGWALRRPPQLCGPFGPRYPYPSAYPRRLSDVIFQDLHPFGASEIEISRKMAQVPIPSSYLP